MIKSLLCLITCTVFLHLSCYGQEDIQKDQLVFDEALEYYYDEAYDSALYLLTNFLDTYPKSPLEPRVKYNIGYILRKQAKEAEAAKAFEEILRSNYKELEFFGGIMEEYTLYKHRSAKHLFEMSMASEDLKKSKKYPYQHFCGNELMADKIYTAKAYAEVYRKERKYDKAIKVMLPYIFDSGLASNDELVDELIEVTALRFSNEEMEAAIQQAVESLRLKNDDAFITLFGEKVKVYEDALYRIGNPAMEENLKLEGLEIYQKVLKEHLLFAKYLK